MNTMNAPMIMLVLALLLTATTARNRKAGKGRKSSNRNKNMCNPECNEPGASGIPVPASTTTTEFGRFINSFNVNGGALSSSGEIFGTIIDCWDVSQVKDMTLAYAFDGDLFDNTAFNNDIKCWDVSSVTDFNGMFAGSKAFNSDISGWDVSAGTSFNSMFFNSGAFNQNLCPWGQKFTDEADARKMFVGSCNGLAPTFPFASTPNNFCTTC